VLPLVLLDLVVEEQDQMVVVVEETQVATQTLVAAEVAAVGVDLDLAALITSLVVVELVVVDLMKVQLTIFNQEVVEILETLIEPIVLLALVDPHIPEMVVDGQVVVVESQMYQEVLVVVLATNLILVEVILSIQKRLEPHMLEILEVIKEIQQQTIVKVELELPDFLKILCILDFLLFWHHMEMEVLDQEKTLKVMAQEDLAEL
jgi:hypothetical protein